MSAFDPKLTSTVACPWRVGVGFGGLTWQTYPEQTTETPHRKNGMKCNRGPKQDAGHL